MSTLTSTNPYTLEENWTVELISDETLTELIEQALTTYTSWSQTSLEERSKLFHELADLLEERKENYARLETIEMGRLYSVAVKWITWTANLMRWYADNVERVLAQESFKPWEQYWTLEGHFQYDPLGVIYGIAPWNFPFNQLLRAAAANIIAGNTQLYKHASNVPLCAQAIQQLFDDAWFPKGVYTTLFIKSSQSELIIKHDAVQGVNLTGGERAGAAIGSLAWKYLKPSVLELWGNDAFVLLDHQDTDSMAAEAVACRISNGGQRCNASKRFIVLDEHYDAFVEAMSCYMDQLVLWDPMLTETTLPPMSSSRLVEEIHDQVMRSIDAWARLVTWGSATWDHNQFYQWTVLADVTPWMPAFDEEIFGPVASVIRSSSVEESIHLANSSPYALSAVVFGDDQQECKRVASQLQWGMIFINNPAWSKASLPFGGVKRSGYGKENGDSWILAFTNKKAVVYTI